MSHQIEEIRRECNYGIKTCSKNTLGVDVITETSPKGESQSNGRIGEAGRTLRGIVRVMNDQTEAEARIEFEGTDNIIPRLIGWNEIGRSSFLEGTDSTTAFERRKGRTCEIPPSTWRTSLVHKT